ncbi:MAG: PIN domain-containing protein [Trueperaceae bacterium]|nr:PIN domain-containing protein [Trueperaceae bacterium]
MRRVFFDTNVLVYLFDAAAPAKRATARRLFSEHSATGALTLSTQVLQEFYVCVTRKLSAPLSEPAALEVVRDLRSFALVLVDADMILGATARSSAERFSFWDALIVEAALSGGATQLLSEDMQNGRRVSGLTIVDPFA